jgi:biopolymer transport protein ExbB
MFDLFLKGGPVMWPLLLLSVLVVGVVLERFWFLLREKNERNPQASEVFWGLVDKDQLDLAAVEGLRSSDAVLRILAYALEQRDKGLANALLQASSRELKRFSKGLVLLDTSITLAPFLGLLGTVVGLIRSFGLLGEDQLQSPSVLTGGIAQALIATAFGLCIAIVSLIPFNYLQAQVEDARHEIEDNATRLELALQKPKTFPLL